MADSCYTFPKRFRCHDRASYSRIDFKKVPPGLTLSWRTMMRSSAFASLTVLMGLLVFTPFAGAQNTEMNPAIQAELDKEKGVIAAWASNPVIVKEVQEQNKKGPIAGLDNDKWKSIPGSDPKIKAFEESPAGRFLKEKIQAKESIFTEAFLSGSNGEKVAFAEKTTYYTHKGMPKFEVPFRK